MSEKSPLEKAAQSVYRRRRGPHFVAFQKSVARLKTQARKPGEAASTLEAICKQLARKGITHEEETKVLDALDLEIEAQAQAKSRRKTRP